MEKQLTMEDIMEKKTRKRTRNSVLVDPQWVRSVIKAKGKTLAQLGKDPSLGISEGALRQQISRGWMSPDVLCHIADILDMNLAEVARAPKARQSIHLYFYIEDNMDKTIPEEAADEMRDFLEQALDAYIENSHPAPEIDWAYCFSSLYTK